MTGDTPTNFKCQKCGLMNSSIEGLNCRGCGTTYGVSIQDKIPVAIPQQSYQPPYQPPYMMRMAIYVNNPI